MIPRSDTDSPTAPAESPTASDRRRKRRALQVGAIALVVVLATVVVLSLTAAGGYRASQDATRSLEARAQSANRAHAMAPWNAQYERQSLLLSAWLLGKQQLDRGDYNSAIETLDRAYRLDIGNPELLALYRRAQDTQALATNRKAHLQHGHEGPGGTLRPQDIER